MLTHIRTLTFKQYKTDSSAFLVQRSSGFIIAVSTCSIFFSEEYLHDVFRRHMLLSGFLRVSARDYLDKQKLLDSPPRAVTSARLSLSFVYLSQKCVHAGILFDSNN